MRPAGRRMLRFGRTARPLAIVLAAGASAGTARLAAQDVDTVRVSLSPDRAVVELRIPNVGEVVEAHAMRFPGQTVDVTEVVREGQALLDALLTREDGALRFRVMSGAPIVVRYEVTGATERIPLFVPGGGAELTVAGEVEESVLVRVDGDPDALSRIDTDTSVPRFTRRPDGTLEAPLTSLPSFVRLSPGGPFSFPRIADALALVLIAIGVVLAVRKLRAANGGPRAGGPDATADPGGASGT